MKQLKSRLTRRTHDEYLAAGQASLEDSGAATATGVKGVSPFVSEVPTIRFSESAPFDVMYLVFLGLVRDLCSLLRGDFFKVVELNNHAARISTKEWEELGQNMAKIGSPASWGRYPRNIGKYIKSFKAEDFQKLSALLVTPVALQSS